MALNGYLILEAFFAVLSLGAAALTATVAAGALVRLRMPAGDGARVEDRVYLAVQLTYVLLGLTLASWVVLYLLLDNFVPLWPGAMCIYGVTRIGEGNPGITGWLPTLVLIVQGMKPLIVFAAGAALVLYRLYRHSGVSVLMPRVLRALVVVALLGAGGAAAELLYLGIPKQDLPVNSGCCSSAAVDSDAATSPPVHEPWLAPAYLAGNFLMALLLWPRFRQDSTGLGAGQWAGALLLAIVDLAMACRFVIDVAAPTLLHLPYHHCIYDLVFAVPESGVAIGLLVWGTFCVGWACVAGWLGRSASTEQWVGAEQQYWRSCAALGYLGTAAMFGVELWLA